MKLSDDLRYKLENVAVGMGVRNTDNYICGQYPCPLPPNSKNMSITSKPKTKN